MEIIFRNVAYTATEYDVVDVFAKTLHSPAFQQPAGGALLNFQANLFMKKRTNRSRIDLPGHAGAGVLTIPDIRVAQYFMLLYGPSPRRFITLGGRAMSFSPSENQPPPGLIEDLLNRPWQNPRALAERHKRDVQLAQTKVRVVAVQLGWLCRDGVYSIEWESTAWKEIRFEDSLRQIVIIPGLLQPTTIAIKYSHIDSIAVSQPDAEQASLLFTLSVAPSFELDPAAQPSRRFNTREKERRTRTPFPNSLQRSGRYIAHWLRVVVASPDDIEDFTTAAQTAHLRHPRKLDYEYERRGLFADSTLDELESWIPTLPMAVAIQVEHLLYERLLDAREVLELRDDIELLCLRGDVEASDVLRAFGAELKTMDWYIDDVQASARAVRDLFCDLLGQADSEESEGTPSGGPTVRTQRADILTRHVAVAPANVSITGPIPDRSNRIINEYWPYQDHFIRVAFTDNDGQTFRHDPDVDTEALIREHVLPILRHGFKLGGRLFEFLAYSQSALKQHSVWMVHPFTDLMGRHHTASTIRASMGTYTKEDERCPARVGARMALAFSATVPSGLVVLSERRLVPDIGGVGPACMTDGAGLISRKSMDSVWLEFNRRSRKRNLSMIRPPPPPSVIQVRVRGAKGTLLVDPMLSGRRIVLRPSMVKFKAGKQYNKIEVCKVFTKPSPAYLNRPLIMVLEARGIPKETFLALQQSVIDTTRLATESLLPAAALLESNGLGGPLGLPALFRRVSEVFRSIPIVEQYMIGKNSFITRCLDFAVNHVLRGLKFRGRIAVPDSWTLVGVPDHHGILKEGEIFVCIQEDELSQVKYLDGKVVVSRSPTCHPGDVMVMRAIGPPPASSALAKVPPKNCVVFSTKGTRSPASCLGGGDYDGDEYVVMTPRSLRPRNAVAPTMYKNTPRQDIGRRYVDDDICQFVADFVINDQLPRIASLWLRIADISREGVYDPRCMQLARLHSVAVDFPKTGIPVKHAEIPLAPNMFPDWSISELGAADHDQSYNDRIYRSERAIGHLFRAVSLPAADQAREEEQSQRVAAKTRKKLTLHVARQALASSTRLTNHPMSAPIRRVVHAAAPLALEHEFEEDQLFDLVRLYNGYCIDLRQICQQNTLSRSRRSQLTEEELVVGTIVARASSVQYRKREDHMVRMNEQMALLKEKVCAELAGDDNIVPWQRMQRTWIAWKLSIVDGQFGSSSFGLIALGAFFEATQEAVDEDRAAENVCEDS